MIKHSNQNDELVAQQTLTASHRDHSCIRHQFQQGASVVAFPHHSHTFIDSRAFIKQQLREAESDLALEFNALPITNSVFTYFSTIGRWPPPTTQARRRATVSFRFQNFNMRSEEEKQSATIIDTLAVSQRQRRKTCTHWVDRVYGRTSEYTRTQLLQFLKIIHPPTSETVPGDGGWRRRWGRTECGGWKSRTIFGSD